METTLVVLFFPVESILAKAEVAVCHVLLVEDVAHGVGLVVVAVAVVHVHRVRQCSRRQGVLLVGDTARRGVLHLHVVLTQHVVAVGPYKTMQAIVLVFIIVASNKGAERSHVVEDVRDVAGMVERVFDFLHGVADRENVLNRC